MTAPVSIAGATFTVTIGTTDWSSQIIDGSIDGSANIVDEFTLGPNQVTTATSTSENVSVNGLYDGDAGVFKAIWDAYKALDAITVTITGDDLEFTGSLNIESCSVPFSAQDSAKFSASFRGPLTASTVV